MRARTISATIALLAIALAGCGKSEAEKQADCQKAITADSTKTDRPDACKDLSQDDYNTLLIDWTLKHSGVVDDDGNVDMNKLLDNE